MTDQTQSPRTIQERSEATKVVINLLDAAEVGVLIPYSEINAAASIEVQGGDRHCLQTARRALRREKKKLFGCVFNAGVKRLENDGMLGAFDKRLVHIRKQARETARDTTCFDFDAATADEKREALAAQAVAGTVYLFTRPRSRKLVALQTKEPRRIPTREMLDLFAKKKPAQAPEA